MIVRFLIASAALWMTACHTPPLSAGPPGAAIAAEGLGTATEAATATLDTYYAAAAAADYDTWIAQFTSDARFYGTDASEDWPRDAFAESVKAGFATGQGWGFQVRDRRVTVAAGGETAWFAEIAHFENTDYTLRPTGVLVRQSDGWKIAQLVMGVPFPNDLYDPMRMALQAAETGVDAEVAAVAAVLDDLHRLASGGDLAAYLSVYTADAMFFGTDESERWTLEDLRTYAEPAFADGEGWTYTPLQRDIVLGPMGNVAWFDEVLGHARYPNTRGSGVLVRTDAGWKVAQYNLTFLVPNAHVGGLSTLFGGGED
ncbi:MAG: nuclear transport factor 2 family protein [Pseudomonadota bacterium]